MMLKINIDYDIVIKLDANGDFNMRSEGVEKQLINEIHESLIAYYERTRERIANEKLNNKDTQ